jgi:hypothetical protein
MPWRQWTAAIHEEERYVLTPHIIEFVGALQQFLNGIIAAKWLIYRPYSGAVIWALHRVMKTFTVPAT